MDNMSYKNSWVGLNSLRGFGKDKLMHSFMHYVCCFLFRWYQEILLKVYMFSFKQSVQAKCLWIMIIFGNTFHHFLSSFLSERINQWIFANWSRLFISKRKCFKKNYYFNCSIMYHKFAHLWEHRVHGATTRLKAIHILTQRHYFYIEP